jgi:adenine deaminase
MIKARDFSGLSGLVDAAAGRKPGDALLKNCRIVNVFTSTVDRGSILISGGKIAAITGDLDGGEYSARREYNLDGAYVIPGLIDSHVHIESSLLTPFQFARAVMPRGTTTVIADPHEIANVAGEDGIRFMIRDAERSPLNCFFMVPSCVPATPLRTCRGSPG